MQNAKWVDVVLRGVGTGGECEWKCKKCKIVREKKMQNAKWVDIVLRGVGTGGECEWKSVSEGSLLIQYSCCKTSRASKFAQKLEEEKKQGKTPRITKQKGDKLKYTICNSFDIRTRKVRILERDT